MSVEESPPRHNTDITDEYRYKYRPRKPMTPKSFYFGSDKDIIQKTWTSTRNGAVLGVGVAGFVFTYDQAGFVLSRAVERSFRHGTPWVIAGIGFGLGTSTAASLRNKEGALNHMIGGLTSGALIGTWYRNVRMGCWTAALMASLAGTLKMMYDNDQVPQGHFRRGRVFNMYRVGWFTERPDPEGDQDIMKDDTWQTYRAKVEQ